MKGVIPSWTEIGRETVIIMAGALLAAVILSRLPAVRDFIQKNTAFGGCNCDGHTDGPAA
ncbi:hypothetical protein [Variovorax sp. 3P27G3]|uniref:hypothetical protein n=1 Tax=Variovorax sp. 3P27G3 TaxID=2502214 RepID=UPI0010F5C1CE|nr:hypothetical protein [Variovorax sp. 3P27G3]